MELLNHARDKDPLLTPLAERVRPRALEDFVGIADLVKQHPVLHRVLNEGPLASIIFWGPPGSGKTTLAKLMAQRPGVEAVNLSAVLSGIHDLRAALKSASDRRAARGIRTVLFVDEIHRWNTSQQDALLPFVERGTVCLLGATTENPSYAINNALLSRCHVIRLGPHSERALVNIMKLAWHTMDTQQGMPPTEYLQTIAEHAQGDARRALNVLEHMAGTHFDSLEELRLLLGETRVYFDKGGEAYYHVTSALIKSMRASKSHDAVYWMMRMVEGGADPLYITRRMLIFASEDIGNADPQALTVAVNTDTAIQRLGMPEGLHALTQCCLYLSEAPKSNAVGLAWQRAQDEIQKKGAVEVPLHLRNRASA